MGFFSKNNLLPIMQMAKKATKYTYFVKLLKNLGYEQNKCSAKIVENSLVWQIFCALCIIILNIFLVFCNIIRKLKMTAKAYFLRLFFAQKVVYTFFQGENIHFSFSICRSWSTPLVCFFALRGHAVSSSAPLEPCTATYFFFREKVKARFACF